MRHISISNTSKTHFLKLENSYEMESSETPFKYDSSQAGKEITTHELFLKLLETSETPVPATRSSDPENTR